MLLLVYSFYLVLTGVGGGFLIVPVLVFILDFPIKHAIGTSLVVIALNCLWGIISRLMGIGTIQLGMALWISIGTVIGIILGVIIAENIKSKYLTKVFALFVILLSIYMFFRTAGFIV
ncbi:MAG: TSUP family transporter [Minisyncoccia bacterium]